MANKLHVITCISNPVRYKSRYALYRDFSKRMEATPNVVLHTAEIAFGSRPHVITEPNNPRHLQLRTDQEIWHKENMLNLVIQKLPRDWEYVAWIDADVMFARPDWVEETIHQLQHYEVVQMFSVCQDLTDGYTPVGPQMTGMVKEYCNGNMVVEGPYPKRAGHCGYAWAATRHAIETLGGLLDTPILGSADYIMATALMGNPMLSVGPDYHPGYLNAIRAWGDKAKKLRKNIGYVDGLLMHHWHGSKNDRGYTTRWKILTEHQFNPAVDLERDWQGLYRLVDHGDERSIQLRDRLRDYFRSRNEDVPFIPK